MCAVEFLPGLDLQALAAHQHADGQHGFHVITPLRREADGAVVLVNRGWLPASLRAHARSHSALSCRAALVDMSSASSASPTAPTSSCPPTTPPRTAGSASTSPTMAAAVGNNALPILIDVQGDQADPPRSTICRCPARRASRLPNDHLQYIVTWYSLTGFLLIFARGLFRK
jgi:surfeit locus 1 family protein